jgi:hypothetical protein
MGGRDGLPTCGSWQAPVLVFAGLPFASCLLQNLPHARSYCYPVKFCQRQRTAALPGRFPSTWGGEHRPECSYQGAYIAGWRIPAAAVLLN